MSFILDALRKAERERKLGQTPDLSDTPPLPGAAPQKPAPTRLIVLFALVLLLAVAAVLFWPQPLPPPEAPVAAAPAPPPPAVVATPPAGAAEVAQADAANALPTPAVPAGPNANAPALDADTAPESLDELVDPASEAIAGRPADAPVTPVDQGLDAGLDPSEVDNEPPPEDEITLSAEDQALADRTTRSHAAARPAPAAEPAPEAEAAPEIGGVKRLRDMPPAFRSNFPAVKLEVHVYDADPAKRWVLIGGKKYIEGTALPEGPQVDAITTDGVVFSHRGERVLLPLNR